MSWKLRAFRRLALLLPLLAILLASTGCAETEADLDYQRDKPATAGDHSYHGWNDANN